MKKFYTSFLLALISVFFISNASAQNLTNYLQAKVQMPTNYNDTLRVSLRSNDSVCKSNYGDDQYRICTPYIGEYGAKVFSISISPKIEGTWVWDDSSTLEFRPAANTQWEPKTNYTVTIDKSTFPALVELNKYTYSFTTLPQASQLSEQKLWTDPSAKANHMYSASFSFLYPIEDKQAITSNLKIAPLRTTSGLEFGKPEYIWSRQNTRLNVNLPVIQLGQNNATVSISLNGMPAYYTNNGIKINDTPLRQRADIPGLNDLFYIKNAYLSLEYSDKFKQEFILNIETSLQTSAVELINNLDIYALPKKSSDEASVPYEWDKAPVLDKGKSVSFTSLDKNSVSTKHKFKVDISPETYVNVVISDNLKSASGLTFAKDKNFVLYATEFTPEISFIQNGNILSFEGSQQVAIHTSQLSELRWEAYKIRKPYLSFIADEYFNSYNRDYYYDYESESTNYDTLSDVAYGKIALKGKGQASSEILYLEMKDLVANHKAANTNGLIRLKLIGMQDGKEVISTEKSLLITDIGMLVKRNANGTRNVYTYSLSENTPLNNIEVQILGENGLALTSAKTNSEGMAILDNVDGFINDKKPKVLTALNTKNNDFSFVSMDRLARFVETSRFDTQGRMQSLSNFQAYIFAERGIFRPGDKLNFGAMVRSSDNSLVPSLPVQAVLYDPQGVKVATKSFNVQDTKYGMETIEWQSDYYSPTGVYRLDILANNIILGTRTVRLEEFQPNILEISSEILPKKSKGWYVISEQDKFDLSVELKNLYGTGAQDRKVTADLRIEQIALSFTEFEGYTFNDPYSDFTNYSNPNLALPSKTTNKDGKANFDIDLSNYAHSKNTYQATIFIEGFEPNGGRAVNTQTSFLFSPAKNLIGYKLSGGVTNLNYIPEGRSGSLEFIQVNSDLERDKNFEYSFVVTQRKYVSNLVKNSQGEFYYEETLVQEELSKKDLKSKNGKILWDIPTQVAGEYMLTVYEKGKNFAVHEVSFNVNGQDVKANAQSIPSTMKLQVPSTDFSAGDKVDLLLSLPYDGFGLITLEADKVLSHVWFKATAGQSTHSIEIPKNYEGRAYFVVSYMKDIRSSDIYLNPYSHSIEPILVNIDKRKIDVDIEVAKLVKTTDDLKVKIKTSENAQAIVFAVDEGILALTNYKSPSPIAYFLEDRALEVSTSQFLDLVMPEVSALAFQESVMADNIMLKSAYGGGLAMAKQNLLNPFKRKAEPPLAYWSGIIDVDKKGTEVNIPIPSYYNGNLRVMAVVINEAAFGADSDNTIIRRDVIVTPQMPLTVSPHDTIYAGVMLTNNANFESDFELNFAIPSSVKLINDIPKSVHLKANEELFIPISFKVLDELGEASFSFAVKAQGLEVARQSSISVRPSTPYTSNIELGIKNSAGSISVKPEIPVYPYNAKSEFVASYAPIALIQGYLTYLENSMDGSSTEALISKAFPYVLLASSPDILYANAQNPKEAEEEAKKLINEAIYAIRSNANYNGLRMWYGNSSVNPLLTVYAGDFLLAFRKAGYSTPADLSVPIFDAIRNIAVQRPNTLSDARVAAYAIWVLTREGYVTTGQIETLTNTLNRANNDMKYWEQDLTAVLLASSLKIMRYDIDVEYDIYDFQYKNFKNSSFMNVFAAQSLFARAMALSFPEELTSQRVNVLTSQSMSSFKNGQSTFSVSQAIATLSELGNNTEDVLLPSAITCENVDGTQLEFSKAVGLSAPLCNEYTLNADNINPIYYQLTTSGYPLKAPSAIVANGLDVKKVILDSRGELAKNVKVGDVLTIKIIANSHGSEQENIVIQDLLSGAFEPVLGNDFVNADSSARKEMREDRALFYVNLTPQEQEFFYEVRATNKGTFTIPAVYAKSLYDSNLNANDIAQTITIE